jgi:SAM-dependent methyltransferase
MGTSSSPSNPSFEYVGDELALFQHARNWKRYYGSRLTPYLQGDVLEIGGGLGATARALCGEGVHHWTSVEPDPELAARMEESFGAEPLSAPTSIIVGTIADVPAGKHFDALIYIDVLEHIEDDRAEMERARERLRPGGVLIVLCPAHQWLFTPFDKAIGHFRRYSRASMAAVAPTTGLRRERLFYLDSVGMLASLANRLLLKASMPTLAQIRFWDSRLVPCSRWLDPLFLGRLGKSVIGIWRRI